MEEKSLAAAAAHGDQEALSLLVERYRATIYTIAFKIVLHEDDALDITQTVFLRLVEKIGDYAGRGSFRAWVAAITAHEAIDFSRRAARRKETPTEPEILDQSPDPRSVSRSADPAEELDRVQRRQLVQEAMGGLSPQQRAIFALRFSEEMGPKEIAQRLDLPASQVRSQLHRAIAKIRRALAEEIV